ncbi:uncharacterized protein [Ptychodera flava]|uniref:uncharacterized protein n=1 Tax=Ptychodera flava TaxID=63121 RepID=UPI00396A1BE7
MVHTTDADVSGSTIATTTDRQLVEASECSEASSITEEATAYGLSCVQQSLEKRNISAGAATIIMASWRQSTKRQYRTYTRRWFQYCSKIKADPLYPDITQVLDFLTELFHSGISYSALNTARSALSALCSTKQHMTVGAHPLVVRFMKGVFNLRPTVSRYRHVWDVRKVLNYLKTCSPVVELSLKTLTLKLVMLLALVTAARSQSLHLLDLSSMTTEESSYTFIFTGLLKQSRPGYVNPVVTLRPYTPDKLLCVCDTLKEYLSRTENFRDNETKLFISYVKPHKAVSKASISRWIREVMTRSGIDTDKFKAHSVRAVATSRAKQSFVPVEHILATAGWSSLCTFAKFYDKPTATDSDLFAHSVLKA